MFSHSCARGTTMFALALIAATISGCGGGGGGSSSPYGAAVFTEFSVPGAGNVPAAPSGVLPDDVAGDAAGNIWFAENHGDAIGKISPTGAYTAYPLLTANGNSDGIAIDGTRNVVYVALTTANKITRLDLTTGATVEITMPTPNAVPGDMIIAPDGTVWISEGYEGGPGSTRIAKMNPTTLAVTEYTPPFVRNGTDGLVLLPNGDLWFVEYADNKICKFSGGVFTEVSMPRTNVNPTNIALDGNGYLWITEQTGNAIARYQPTTGAWKEVTLPTANGQPSGVCVDKSNNVWFTEYNGNKIGVIPAGSTSAIDYPIPTANAGAEDIQLSASGSIIFSEQNSNKVGKISVPGLTN